MEDLNLPIIDKPTPGPKTLSMDDYLEFVEFNIRYTLDMKACRRWKELNAVDKPFKLK